MITVWVLVTDGWWVRTFYLPPDACALVQAGLESLYPKFHFIEAEYIQLIHYMGGGIPMFFVGCQ